MSAFRRKNIVCDVYVFNLNSSFSHSTTFIFSRYIRYFGFSPEYLNSNKVTHYEQNIDFPSYNAPETVGFTAIGTRRVASPDRKRVISLMSTRFGQTCDVFPKTPEFPSTSNKNREKSMKRVLSPDRK